MDVNTQDPTQSQNPAGTPAPTQAPQVPPVDQPEQVNPEPTEPVSETPVGGQPTKLPVPPATQGETTGDTGGVPPVTPTV